MTPSYIIQCSLRFEINQEAHGSHRSPLKKITDDQTDDKPQEENIINRQLRVF